MKKAVSLILLLMPVYTLYSQKIGFQYGNTVYPYKFNRITVNGYPTLHKYENIVNFNTKFWIELEKNNFNIIGFAGLSNKGFRVHHYFNSYDPDTLPLPEYTWVDAIYIDAGIGIGKEVFGYGIFSVVPYFILKSSLLFDQHYIIVYNDDVVSVCSSGNCIIVHQNIEKIIFSSGLNLKFNFDFERVGIFFQLEGDYYFNKIEKNTIKGNTFGLGLNLGMSYKLVSNGQNNKSAK